jgi:hypothetical protein
VKRILRWLLALFVVTRARRGDADPRAEAAVVALLLSSAAAAAFFVVAYAVGFSTQVLGSSLAAALALLAVALLVVGKRLVVTEELAEPYPDEEDREAQRDVARIVRESGDGLTRKRLLGSAATVAGGALGAALITPAVSLGPALDTSRLNESPWRAGRRLVDEQGRPLTADEIDAGPFYTAFPEGAERKAIGSPLVLVRLRSGGAAATAGARRLGARGNRRVLEDLHARRLRRRAVPQPEVPADAAAPGARLPLPLLDVRPRRRRHRALRPGRAAAAAAAADDRRRPDTARRR